MNWFIRLFSKCIQLDIYNRYSGQQCELDGVKYNNWHIDVLIPDEDVVRYKIYINHSSTTCFCDNDSHTFIGYMKEYKIITICHRIAFDKTQIELESLLLEAEEIHKEII